MNEMIDFLTSKEIIVVYIVIAVAFFLCFIIFLFEKRKKKRRLKQNTRKLNKLVEDVNLRVQEGLEDDKSSKRKKVSEPVIENVRTTSYIEPDDDFIPMESDFVPPVVSNAKREVPVVSYDTPVVPKSSPVVSKPTTNDVYYDNPIIEMEPPKYAEVRNDFRDEMDAQINKVNDRIEELVYTDAEPDREEATRELIRLTEELEKAERAQRQGITVEDYESQQEENAIISLDELNRRSEEMYAANELTQYADEGNEPISLSDLEKRKKVAMPEEYENVEQLEETPFEKAIQQTYRQPGSSVYSEKVDNSSHAYQQRVTSSNDKIFSSVFGMNTTPSRTREEIDEELQKTSEFLLSLKDLQNRLNS